ncbi:MAG: S-adenosylmethionine-dependent methyltransferase [Glaciecola sp.]|jgi:S-adenosylmethionine-dependent methyltransferase
MDVLDLGGGTGMMSLEFAKHGHNVTVLDMSDDVLAIAKRRLQAYPNTQYILGELTKPNTHLKSQYDFIICHAVLEWLPDPLSALLDMRPLLKVNGRLSLSFFNHDAKVFSNLLYANFDYVEKGLPSKNTVRLNPHNAQKPKEVIALLNDCNEFYIKESRGIRCFHDYIIDKTKIDSLYQQLFDMEVKYSNAEPYKWLGKYFHIMLEAR